jgi:hypothetical protein
VDCDVTAFEDIGCAGNRPYAKVRGSGVVARDLL